MPTSRMGHDFDCDPAKFSLRNLSFKGPTHNLFAKPSSKFDTRPFSCYETCSGSETSEITPSQSCTPFPNSSVDDLAIHVCGCNTDPPFVASTAHRSTTQTTLNVVGSAAVRVLKGPDIDVFDDWSCQDGPRAGESDGPDIVRLFDGQSLHVLDSHQSYER